MEKPQRLGGPHQRDPACQRLCVWWITQPLGSADAWDSSDPVHDASDASAWDSSDPCQAASEASNGGRAPATGPNFAL
jgi:hypothetical protein